MPPALPPSDPSTKNRFVGLATITGAREHVTTFAYTDQTFSPSTVAPGPVTFYQKRIRLTGASTIDGPIILGDGVREVGHVHTLVQDTQGNWVEYEFLGQTVPSANVLGSPTISMPTSRARPLYIG